MTAETEYDPTQDPRYAPEQRAIEAHADRVGTARCPCCNHVLVCRLTRRGPQWHCGCRSAAESVE